MDPKLVWNKFSNKTSRSCDEELSEVLFEIAEGQAERVRYVLRRNHDFCQLRPRADQVSNRQAAREQPGLFIFAPVSWVRLDSHNLC